MSYLGPGQAYGIVQSARTFGNFVICCCDREANKISATFTVKDSWRDNYSQLSHALNGFPTVFAECRP
jgi:hypothetical protein